MSWCVEVLNRDGSVSARAMLSAPASSGEGAIVSDLGVLSVVSVLRIGRALDNDLVVDDAHCAPYHARFEASSDASARLMDLGSINRTARGRGERRRTRPAPTGNEFGVEEGDLFRIGQTIIRVRTLAASRGAEVALNLRRVWPWALLGLVLVLGDGAWDLWRRHVESNVPRYLNDLSGQALLLCVWSGAYALLGRLISGNERFFTHVVIASCGYVGLQFTGIVLETLAFSTGALWPMQILQSATVLVAAAVVRLHLRVADPRHWSTMRYAVALVASLAILVPIAQKWISHGRLTDVQTLALTRHPALLMAKPLAVGDFDAQSQTLQARADALKQKALTDSEDNVGDE